MKTERRPAAKLGIAFLRWQVEQSLLLVTEDLEKAARQQRDGLQLAAKGESSLMSMQALEAQARSFRVTVCSQGV